jgi:hypothetical protein
MGGLSMFLLSIAVGVTPALIGGLIIEIKHRREKTLKQSRPILIDREGVAYLPSRRVVLKAKD